MRSAHTPRSRLATWWRTTDPPTPLLTIKPTRAGSAPSRGRRWSTRVGLGARRPVRTAAVKSVRRCIRCAAGSTGSGCEASAALAAPRRQNRAARAGAHAKPEAVSLGSTPVVGLERTLRHEVTPDLAQGRSRWSWWFGAGKCGKRDWRGWGQPPPGRHAATYRTSRSGGSVKLTTGHIPGKSPARLARDKPHTVSDIRPGVGETRRPRVATVSSGCRVGLWTTTGRGNSHPVASAGPVAPVLPTHSLWMNVWI